MMRVAVWTLAASLVASGCGSSGGGAASGATAITIAGSPATNGVFDPAPASDGSSLWMSHSIVTASPHAAVLNQVRTRIARSDDAGATWSDVGVDPNSVADPDLSVPDGKGGTTWATWRFEVSRLVYDPYDADANARWKLVWHRMLAAVIDGEGTPIPANSWIGYSSAPDPTGPWRAERKLFTGTLYNSVDMDPIIGAPEFPLAADYPAGMGGCAAFTEPGMLARADGLYVSLQCGGGGKVVLLRCDRSFSSCNYVGDLLADSEASSFAVPGQKPVNGFAATELVEIGGTVYLIVTGYDTASQIYHGCLVFHVDDLALASVERADGRPVLVARVAGSPGSFNGACGYDGGATATGIIYSEYTAGRPQFHLWASHHELP